MTKAEIINRLTAAGVAIPSNANVVALTELAAANKVDISDPPAGNEPTPAGPAADPSTAPARYEAMIEAKVAAGLSREMATEVVKRQMDYDATLKSSEG